MVAYLFIVFCLILLWSTLFFVNSSDAYIWCRFSESLALLDLSDMLPLDFIGEYLLLIFSSSELLVPGPESYIFGNLLFSTNFFSSKFSFSFNATVFCRILNCCMKSTMSVSFSRLSLPFAKSRYSLDLFNHLKQIGSPKSYHHYLKHEGFDRSSLLPSSFCKYKSSSSNGVPLLLDLRLVLSFLVSDL